MFDTAELVTGDRDAARMGAMVRVVSTTGLGGQGAGDTLVTTGAGRAGGVLGGAFDAVLASLPLGVTDVAVPEDVALRAGRSCGGTLRVLVQPVVDLPDVVWQVLAAREAVCLVTDLDGPRAGRTTWFTLETLATGHDAAVGGGPARHTPEVVAVFGRGVSGTAACSAGDGTELLVHALWPVPRLLVLGGGPVAAALPRLAESLGWAALVVPGPIEATRVVLRYGRGDVAVACTHGSAGTAPFILAALTRGLGYVAAVAPAPAHDQLRHELAAHGVPAAVIDQVRGPAGLDLGGHTAPEVALSILAEAVAVRSCATGRPLTVLAGPRGRPPGPR